MAGFDLIDGVKVWGTPDMGAVEQIKRCAAYGDALDAALMADHHLGYSQPIGGVVAYPEHISPSGVGYDIACGVAAARTPLLAADVDIAGVLDEIQRRIEFGIGKNASEPSEDHAVFDDPAWQIPQLNAMKRMAAGQLGTVGSGNHYVDLLVDDAGLLWTACHFGSRGLGHKTATGYMKLAQGIGWDDRARGETMQDAPTLIRADSPLGEEYLAAMMLAGRYAYAGRDIVIATVLDILGTTSDGGVHNHHNFAWHENHRGQDAWVVRKGATPAFPGDMGFVGGSMADISAVVRGVNTRGAAEALHSTVHGAGRVMSRTAAAGKLIRKGPEKGQRVGGAVSAEMMHQRLQDWNVQLRGGGRDEAPQVYRDLEGVLAAHSDSIEVVTVMKPLGVVMAGDDVYDPYKD